MLTGKQSVLTRETAHVAQSKVYFEHTKILSHFPGFQFTPFRKLFANPVQPTFKTHSVNYWQNYCFTYFSSQLIRLYSIIQSIPMKLFIVGLFGLFLSSAVFSQDKTFVVHGKVIDEKTKQPLANASVFCQNTTTGTTSNNEGAFRLRLNNGGYDLVVSYTSYETKSMRISNGNKENDSLIIELKQQDKSMDEVVVAGSAEVADGWDKYGNFFMANFIGTTPNAADCNIENKDVVKFYFYKKRNKLKVKSKGEILVTNNALGYRIKYQLDSFVYDYNTRISSYTGYPFFEELKGSSEQEEAWKKNRFKSYRGSRLHFMRCWYDSTLKEEGFNIELLDNNDKATALDNPYNSEIYSVDSGNYHDQCERKIEGKL